MNIIESLFGAPGSEQSQAMAMLAAGLIRGDGAGGLIAANEVFSPQNRMRSQMMQLQLEGAKRQAEDDSRKREWLQSLPSPQFQSGIEALTGGGGPTKENAARIAPVSPLLESLYQGARSGAVSPGDYFKALSPEAPVNKIDPEKFTPASLAVYSRTRNYGDLVPRDKLEQTEGVIWNPYDPRNAGRALANPNKPFSLDPTGQAQPNAAYQQYELNKARAGATNLNVGLNTDKSYFGNVAEGLAKNDVAAIEAGRSAPERVATAQRVKELLKANPITGTGAEARLAINKAFTTAGLIDGKDVATTEVLMTQLAGQALDAIKSSGLGGGNGFSNADRAFLERARAGTIDMTNESLSRIADLNERTARASIQRANTVMGKLRGNAKSGDMGHNLDPIEEPPAAKAVGKVFDKMPTANPSNKGRFLTDTTSGKRYQSNGMQWVEVR